MDTAAICEEKAQAHRKEILEECECSEKAHAEFEAAKQECVMLDAAAKEQCENEAQEAFIKAHDACTPTECEKKYNTIYAETMEQCRADGGTDVICTPEAEVAA